MTNLRSGLRSLLEGSLPGYKIIGYPFAPSVITEPTVALYATNLEHLAQAPNGHYSIEYKVEVFTSAQTDMSRVDDALDDALTDLLDALWDSDSYLLDTAVRTVSEDNKFHSWTLTVRGGLVISKEQ